MRKLLLIVFVLLSPFIAGAYQISGYISLKYLNGTTYQATVVEYSIGAPLLDTMRIYWGDGTSTLTHRSNSGSDTVCDSVIKSVYTGIHTFLNNGTYRIWVDTGNRVPNIVNMSNSSFQDIFLFHTLNINSFTGDSISSPTISNEPICSYGCPTQCYTFNLGASSSMGDSLSYSLGSCGAIGYYIPANVTIDPVTGTLIWCNPPSNGLYNFSIRITTYKSAIIVGQKHEIAADTEEVELEANIQSNCTLSVNDFLPAAPGVIVYPNPNNGIFTIQWSEANNQKSVMEVYNMLGEKVYASQLSINKGQLTIDLAEKPAGIYLYRVITETGNLVSEGKFIIQK